MNSIPLTDLDPLHSGAPLIVYVDYKSPYAFVAMEPTYALEDALGVEFDWRPITLDIPSYLGSAKLNKQGKVTENKRSASQWTGVKYAYKDARRYAALQGHTLRGTEKIWDTRLVHIGMLWVKAQSNTLLRRYSNLVYPPFWRRELDVEDIQVVIRLIQDSGAEPQGFVDFANGDGAALHDALQSAIFEAGIFGVPNYVINNNRAGSSDDPLIFFGREHLPAVRWHLEQHLGGFPPRPHPDIGYQQV